MIGRLPNRLAMDRKDFKRSNSNNEENFEYDCDNLESLPILTPSSVLACLAKRFRRGSIYTWAGSTLVVCNPFRNYSILYDDNAMKMYLDATAMQDKALPHVYAIAAQAHDNICSLNDDMNQTIIVSGESGSGKTYSAYHLLQYLSSLELRHQNNKTATIEKWVLDTNIILEAFGNAATERNDNSSRFGKFLKLHYADCELVGASIDTYLLEKTRVVCQQANHNFHIFYQLLHGCNETEAQEWRLPDKNLLLQSNHGCDGKRLKEFVEAMERLQISTENRNSIFKMLSAILRLSQVSFLFNELDEVYTVDASSEEILKSLQDVCLLLGLKEDDFVRQLTNRTIVTGFQGTRRQSIFHKPCTDLSQCEERRNCLAMLLYQKLFDWIVERINARLNSSCLKGPYIGILDIFGFERFRCNKFEQLCINYANERLQQLFVQHFLRDKQTLLKEELIEVEFVDYTDNRPCLDVLDSNISIFGLLNEKCKLNKSCDEEELLLAMANMAPGSNGLLQTCRVPRGKQNNFTIRHYAGPITYQTSYMIQRNKDNIPSDIVDMLLRSDGAFVIELFASHLEFMDAGKYKRKQTVFSKFKSSLDSLLSTISESNVSFVRCIKPNYENKPDCFDISYVKDQLKACGIVETIALSRSSYPIVFLYRDFIRKYGIILRSSQIRSSEDANKENCPPMGHIDQRLEFLSSTRRHSSTGKRRRGAIDGLEHQRQVAATILKCTRLKLQADCEFGKNRIFLNANVIFKLECYFVEIRTSAVEVIERMWRLYRLRFHLKRLRAMAKINGAILGWRHRQRMKELIAATIIIQKFFRKCKQRKTVAAKSREMQVDGNVGSRKHGKRSNCVKAVKECHTKSAIKELHIHFHCKPFPLILFHKNGIFSVRRLAKFRVKFHTKVSSLPFSFMMPREFTQCSITDALT